VFGAIVQADLVWLAVIAVLMSAVAVYYYLRVIMYMLFREPEEEFAVKEPISGGMAAALAVSAIATVVIGVMPSWLWDAVVSAFNTLFN
jgi:NADH-quinone oxidoreductase subunit N